MNNQILTTGQAAKCLRVTRQWINKLIKAGRLTTFDQPGLKKHSRITEKELRRFAADNDMNFYEVGTETDCASEER